MNWKPVDFTRRIQPRSGTYKNWKRQVADECHHQCVYCAIHESRFGGLDNFHIDHFRPKSRFAKLENVIINLFLACAICNRFKSNDWPNEPRARHSVASYPDPSKCDYNQLFKVSSNNYVVSGRYLASKYVTDRLYLNRPQLVIERRAHALERRIKDFQDFAKIATANLSKSKAEPRSVIKAFTELSEALISLSEKLSDVHASRPYNLDDVRRKKAKR